MDEMVHYDLCTKLDKMDIFGREVIVDDKKWNGWNYWVLDP